MSKRGASGLREIPLTKGFVAVVDEADFAWLSSFAWHTLCVGPNVYACRGDYIGARKSRAVLMHRQILLVPAGLDVDHIDGNGLHNYRANLRPATRAQNHFNRRKQGGSSVYKGVSWSASRRRWCAAITLSKHTYNLGRYLTESEAGHAYDKAARKLFGAFARLNFPETS